MKKKTLIGYIGGYWSLHWEDDNFNVNHYGKGTRRVVHESIYKTLKDGCFPIATGYPVKVSITIKEIK